MAHVIASSASAPAQFPCVCRADGQIELHPAFHKAMTDGSKHVASLAASLPDPVDFDALCSAIGVKIESEHGKKTSHGKVMFGAHAATGVQVAVKVMGFDAAAAPRNDAAFVECLVAWIGSRLVEKQHSVGFPLLYGTYVVRYKGATSVAVVMEKLGDSLTGVLRDVLGRRPEDIRWKDLASIIAQVALIAAQGQHVLGLVHNDKHLGNLHLGDARAGALVIQGKNNTKVTVPCVNGKKVVVIDFGRASLRDKLGTDQSRIETTELQKFKNWERNSFGADMMHFVAMVLLAQPTFKHIETGAELDGAEQCGKAIVRLMKQSLRCPSDDMYAEYTDCHKEMIDTGCKACARKAIHKLRGHKTGCAGTTPQQWLDDTEFMSAFDTADPDSVGFSPSPDLKSK